MPTSPAANLRWKSISSSVTTPLGVMPSNVADLMIRFQPPGFPEVRLGDGCISSSRWQVSRMGSRSAVGGVCENSLGQRGGRDYCAFGEPRFGEFDSALHSGQFDKISESLRSGQVVECGGGVVVESSQVGFPDGLDPYLT